MYIYRHIYIHNYIYIHILMCIYRARRIRKLFCQSREPLAFGLCNLSSMWRARRTVHAPSPVWTAGCPALKLCTAASSRTPGAIHNSQEIGALLRKTGHKSLAPANVGSFVRSIPIYICIYIWVIRLSTTSLPIRGMHIQVTDRVPGDRINIDFLTIQHTITIVIWVHC